MNSMSISPNETYLGQFRATRLLGEGGMGQVYLGRDLRSGDEVVIKVMHDHLAKDANVRANFQRELDLMKQFHHPYSVQLLAGSIDGPKPCLVMEYVNGIDLDKFQQELGTFELDRIALWLGQLCQVLHVAHGCHILHHDLTPANLMLQNIDEDHESIKVMDFGLASLMTAYHIPLEKLTHGKSNSIGGGTPDFMSPEQIRGEQIDHRSDLYSVGVMLYKFMTGALPFQEATEVSDILLAHLHQRPPSFAERGIEHIPPKIEKVVFKLLTKFPHERIATAKNLALEFADALGEPITPRGVFDEALPQLQPQQPRYNPRDVVDTLEAWMPESVAIMKLRAFVASIGGTIVSSDPGVIRLHLPDPASTSEQPVKRSLFSFGAGPKVEPRYLKFSLFMDKREAGTRSLVEIRLVKQSSYGVAPAEKSFLARIVRELRAYMMIGR
jgi:serine/threonine-protein kinase